MHRDKSLPVPAAKQAYMLGPDHWFQYQYRPAYAKKSDLLLMAQMALPFIGTIPNMKDRGWVNATLVCSQSLLWTMNITQGIKLMKLRSRPLVYALNTPESVKNNIDARYSFISGHSSAAFCLATSFTLAMKQMNMPATRRTILSAASFITAGGIAVMRVAAGKHYPTDVLAGILVGCGVALLNHQLHVRL
ncbi:MAG: phosphatase PAP2 family protein [Bacteroidetes bacterium]|nr:phosphatase PAP2 family protein [Bacteroidota bacterium]